MSDFGIAHQFAEVYEDEERRRRINDELPHYQTCDAACPCHDRPDPPVPAQECP